MNGYLPETEGSAPTPQIERILEVAVNRVIAFSHAPHGDVEEQEGIADSYGSFMMSDKIVIAWRQGS